MNLGAPTARLSALAERIDALSLRERGIIFAAAIALVYVAWQLLLMDPLDRRARAAQARLAEFHAQLAAIERLDRVDQSDPTVVAANRNRALRSRVAELDAQLRTLASDYVAPDRVADMLREMLDRQHGLRLISLRNLPVESLSRAPQAQTQAATPAATADAAPDLDPGPYLHPVEIVVEGDYAGIEAYLGSLEQLPWRLQWRRLDLASAAYPTNRARLIVGALSLSRDWIDL